MEVKVGRLSRQRQGQLRSQLRIDQGCSGPRVQYEVERPCSIHQYWHQDQGPTERLEMDIEPV